MFQNLEVRKDSITKIDVEDNIIFARIRNYYKGERCWNQTVSTSNFKNLRKGLLINNNQMFPWKISLRN